MPLSSASCHHTPWKLELLRNRKKGNEAGLKVVPKKQSAGVRSAQRLGGGGAGVSAVRP